MVHISSQLKTHMEVTKYT